MNKFNLYRARILILSLTLIIIGGCSGKKTRAETTEVTNSGTVQTAEDIGPKAPDEFAGPPEPEQPLGPEPDASYVAPKDGYVLILGPGLARTMAYLGVLREFEDQHLTISAVVGVEMGAVIGGIWASTSMNNLEWEMHKFKTETLLDFPILGKKVAQGKKLTHFLESALKINRLEKMKVPIFVASLIWEDQKRDPLLDHEGTAVEAIRAAMGIPGVVKTSQFNGTQRVSAALESPFPVEQAKALGVGKVVCVDVINGGNNFSPKDALEENLAVFMRSVASIAKRQLKECDVVLSIPANGVSYIDFDAKADLIFEGRKAVKLWLERKE